jgi:hypothetical protein
MIVYDAFCYSQRKNSKMKDNRTESDLSFDKAKQYVEAVSRNNKCYAKII